MSNSREAIERIRRFRAAAVAIDPELAQPIDEGLESLRPELPLEEELELESIALRRTRPVLAIKGDRAELVFRDEDDVAIWKKRLTDAEDRIRPAIQAVGRIELANAEKAWVGTGWLVADGILVTNRHVAREFARGDTLEFLAGVNGARVAPSIDFLQELDTQAKRLFKLRRTIHIEPDGGPDMAFFEVEPRTEAAALTKPVPLRGGPVEPDANVAIIGYPARDGRIREPDLMERIYGSVYDKKRLAPGAVTAVEERRLLHNCTTLGGNSGSVVLSLTTGEALGLHYSGRFLETNFAVRADQLRDRVERLDRKPRPSSAATPRPLPRPAPRVSEVVAPRLSETNGDAERSITIPLVVTVSLGGERPERRQRAARPRVGVALGGLDDIVAAEEAAPEDYEDREGYKPDFLEVETLVELPRVVRRATQVLKFEASGRKESELRYQHFSVVMNEPRRMCFFSAVNIDGHQSKKSGRGNWRFDPRIPRELQIMGECYGSPPKFSRGHMTRREDPAWGNATTVRRGSDDSMHVTNAVPQMQAFNSPIWLALEDFALQNARRDSMKISVFTGPYFDFDRKKDPVLFGVPIPRRFWKVIAFVHDETGELTATGYEMSQEASLPSAEEAEEFVFGDFVSPQLGVSTQVSIARIEQRSGLSFASLADFDPLASDEEGIEEGTEPPALERLEHIRFF